MTAFDSLLHFNAEVVEGGMQLQIQAAEVF